MDEPRKRRGWQFGIRDVLWLTVVVALAVGWWLDRQKLQAQGDKHQHEIVQRRHEIVRLSLDRREIQAQNEMLQHEIAAQGTELTRMKARLLAAEKELVTQHSN